MKSKSLLYLCLGILCLAPAALHAQASVSTLVTVEENGPRSKQLNFVYLSEGFTAAEMGTFAAEVQRAVDYLFAREPWTRYRKYCNVYRIEVPSAESGTSDPDNEVKRNTYFQSYYWPGIDRLNVLSEAGETRAYGILNAFVPEYDVPVAIVNTTRYGGSGGPIAVATRDEYGPALVEHETGHSFALLGDEYDNETPGYNKFEFPNTTKQTTLAKLPWRLWMEQGTPFPRTPENDDAYREAVGHFEGANYHEFNNFRAHDLSYMRGLEQRIGQVNREAILLATYKRVSLVNEYSPAALTQTHSQKTNLTFSVSPKTVLTAPGISVEWLLNGVPMEGETGDSLTVATENLGNGTFTLKAVVRDPIDWIRKPTTALAKEIIWTLKLSNQVDPPVITTPLAASKVQRLGSEFSLDATATGPGPITYEWLLNNKPLKPAVTTPTLSLGHISLADGGTYTVKVRNAAHVITQNCALHVVDLNTTRVVVGKGKNATLSYKTSPKLPPCTWSFNEGLISNGGRYSGATTPVLQIKGVTEADTGNYFLTCGDFTTTVPVNLQVVTAAPDYTEVSVVIAPGHVGWPFERDFPLPGDLQRLPNSFSASKLPAGLKLDPKTGQISGYPTTASSNQTEGDVVTFTVGNEFNKVVLPVRILIRPLPAGIEGSYSGYVLQNSPLGGPTGGRVDMTVLTTGSFSGKLVIGTQTLPFSGQVGVQTPTVTQAYSFFKVSPKHLEGQEVLVQFNITDGGDEDPLTAVLEAPGLFMGWRNKWLPPENDDVFKGYHTFAFTVPAGTDVSVPKGNGFGSVTIDANGKTTVTGKLADGESFTSSSHLSHLGGVLVYQQLYTTAVKGGLVGVLDLDPGEEGGPAEFTDKTFTQWTRPPDTRGTARVYRDGFGPLDMNAFGGLYTPPVKPGILMGLEPAGGNPPVNASLSFAPTVGDDLVPVDAGVGLEIKTVAVAKVTTANPKAVTFSATPADGRFKGAYTTKDNDPRPPLAPNKPRPQISRKADYQGIIVTREGILGGYGFFLRDALPKADSSTTPTTSPRYSGDLRLERVGL